MGCFGIEILVSLRILVRTRPAVNCTQFISGALKSAIGLLTTLSDIQVLKVFIMV